MRKYKTLLCEPSTGGVLDGNESEGPSLVLEEVYNQHPTETCFYWFDLLIRELCLLLLPLTQRKTLSAGPLRSELALATGEQHSSLRFGNMQLQKLSLRSKGMAVSKAQFGHSCRLIAIHSGRTIPWTLLSLEGGEHAVS